LSQKPVLVYIIIASKDTVTSENDDYDD